VSAAVFSCAKKVLLLPEVEKQKEHVITTRSQRHEQGLAPTVALQPMHALQYGTAGRLLKRHALSVGCTVDVAGG
jgi:hypothetical protein